MHCVGAVHRVVLSRGRAGRPGRRPSSVGQRSRRRPDTNRSPGEQVAPGAVRAARGRCRPSRRAGAGRPAAGSPRPRSALGRRGRRRRRARRPGRRRPRRYPANSSGWSRRSRSARETTSSLAAPVSSTAGSRPASSSASSRAAPRSRPAGGCPGRPARGPRARCPGRRRARRASSAGSASAPASWTSRAAAIRADERVDLGRGRRVVERRVDQRVQLRLERLVGSVHVVDVPASRAAFSA